MSRTPIATWDTPRTSIATPPTGTARDCTGLRMRNDRVVRRGVMSLLVGALLMLDPACGSDSPSVAPTSTSSTASATSTPSTTTAQSPPAPIPQARTEVAGAYWNGRIAVVGGFTADGAASNRVDLYNP